MSAARVLNPVALSVRASPFAISRNLSCSCQEQKVNRIKRDLFGAANHVETYNMNDEIEKHQEHAKRKWGFDFRSGLPLNHSQYIWKRVSFNESHYTPEMYTLTRVAHVRPMPAEPNAMDLLMDERADRENFSASATDTDSCDDSQDESPTSIFKVPTVASLGSSNSILTRQSAFSHLTLQQQRKRQPKITEYMKERKRLLQTPKKLSPAAKRMRTNSGSSASGAMPHNNSANSISSHFMLRSSTRRFD